MQKLSKHRIWMTIIILLSISIACGLFSGERESSPTVTPPPPTNTFAPTNPPPADTPTPSLPPPTPEPSPTQAAPTVTPEPEGQIEVLDIFYQEEFEDTPRDWITGSSEDDYIELERDIIDGNYRWKATAKQPVVSFDLPDPPVELPDGEFIYSASIKIEDHPADMSYGLVFRAQDWDNYYYFQLTTDGYFAVFALENNEWLNLLDFKSSDLIRDNLYNTLEVHANGSSYQFKINDIVVAELVDERFQAGNIGVAIEFSEAGDSGVMLVDNVRVWIPGEGAAAREEIGEVEYRSVSVETYNTDPAVFYELQVPMDWTYTTAQGYEIICEPDTQAVCFSAYVQDDWQEDDIALQENSMGKLYENGFTILHAQHTQINGLPAYFVSYTYEIDGELREGVATYIAANGVGIELRGFGLPSDIELYREVLNHMMESFKFEE